MPMTGAGQPQPDRRYVVMLAMATAMLGFLLPDDLRAGSARLQRAALMALALLPFAVNVVLISGSCHSWSPAPARRPMMIAGYAITGSRHVLVLEYQRPQPVTSAGCFWTMDGDLDRLAWCSCSDLAGGTDQGTAGTIPGLPPALLTPARRFGGRSAGRARHRDLDRVLEQHQAPGSRMRRPPRQRRQDLTCPLLSPAQGAASILTRPWLRYSRAVHGRGR